MCYSIQECVFCLTPSLSHNIEEQKVEEVKTVEIDGVEEWEIEEKVFRECEKSGSKVWEKDKCKSSTIKKFR